MKDLKTLEIKQKSMKSKTLKRRIKRLKRLSSRGQRIEASVRQHLKSLRTRVYRQGYPDCLVESNGKLYFIEVKSGEADLNYEQRRMHRLLKKHGFNILVINPDKMPNWKLYISHILKVDNEENAGSRI